MIVFALLLQAAAPDVLNHRVWGAGGESCRMWTDAQRRGPADHKRVAYTTWLMGFVTAANMARVGDGYPDFDADAERMVGWVDDHCRANPTETIEIAGLYLTLELSGF
jgi:hypothetical protein